jgi:uncharacterized protein
VTASGLYTGWVTHQRFRPKLHRLRYKLAQILIDLDEIDVLARQTRLFARSRFAPIAFHDHDYGDRSGRDLRTQLAGWLAAAGITWDGGAIRLLTMPRIFGHVFNPISTWFAYARDGSLAATVYEVTNTFHDRHFYAVAANPDASGAVRQSANKSLYVSPFLDMDMRYDFALTPPGDTVSLCVTGHDAGGRMIVASFTGKRRAFDDRALAAMILAIPFMTLRVVAGIHWEALKLWLKGVGIRRHPAPPAVALTAGVAGRTP